MSNDKRKSPFSGLTEGDEQDWDKALNAWELPDGAAPRKDEPPPKPLPKAAPLPPRPAPVAPSAPKPLPSGPPRPAGPPPTSPPRSVRIDNPPRATFESFGDEEEEATVVARVSPELLADASSKRPVDRAPESRGAGLGQVFGRTAPAAPRAAGDALLETLFEDEPARDRTPGDDASVVTSARQVEADARSSIPDDERRRPLETMTEEVPDGVLLDPFAEPRDERAPTLRPGATSEEATAAEEIADSAPTPVKAAAEVPERAKAPPPPPPPRIPRAAPPPPPAPPPPASLEELVPVFEPEPLEDESASDAAMREIRLESVPPDAPLESASAPLVEVAEAAPDVLTLQGGHDLPEVGIVPPHSSVTIPAPPALEPDGEVPTRNKLQTLEGLGGDARGILEDPEQLETWLRRARFIEDEARATLDRAVKARGLLVASELFALAGDDGHAHELAAEARDLAPTHPLTHRQARGRAVRDGDWTAVTFALQAESRSASTPAARVHGTLVSAEIARVVAGDNDLAMKRLEQAIRAAPGDVRAYVNRLGAAIGEAEPLPKLRWPEDAPELAPVVEAAATLMRWRAATDKTVAFANPIDALLRARASLRARDPAFAMQALDSLAETAGVSDGSSWLKAAIALAYPSEDPSTENAGATAALKALADRAPVARRALVALLLEKGRGADAVQAMSAPDDTAFSAQDRAVIATLAGADAPTLEPWLAAISKDDGAEVLGSAVRSALGESITQTASPEVRLSRLLAAKASPEDLSRALAALSELDPASAIARVLKTEVQIETGQVEPLAESLAAAEKEGEEDTRRDRALLAGLVFELAGQPAKARELYAAALEADERSEAAARAKIAVSAPSERSGILESYAANVEDARTGSLLLLEAAHSGGDGSDPESYPRLLKQAHEKAPSLPFASWLAERRARARGEFESIVEWLRERREPSDDTVEQAYDLVREALLVADRDLEAARELLEQASLARPTDLALRELYERLSPEPPADRAAFWAERALAATGGERARLALAAALEFERGGNFVEAARLAHASLEAEDSAFARIAAARNDTRAGLTTNLTGELLEQSKSSDDVQTRVEAFERLAELDEVVKADPAGVLAWHRAVLEQRPGHLPSLAKLEQGLISDGNEDELEPIAGELAKALEGSEASAHAHLATRLRTKAGPWQSGLPFVQLAYARPEPPLWALREMEAHAALANDAPIELAVARALIEQTSRPLEVATLSLRAADAADRLGEFALAKELLIKAANVYPTHIMVHRALADLFERTGDIPGAADAWEAVATLSAVPAHKLDASHKAAVLWIDRAGDAGRGRAALEAAAQIDVTHGDVFTRLQTLYVAAGDREALASLLESRLASVEDPNERIELEVVRGRTLAEIGDAAAAKRALSFALEASPDHPDALSAFADISYAEQDWTAAEQALIRLVRLLPDTAKQASIYSRLGALYDEHLPNPERAELAYREVLRRIPGEETAEEKLVDVYRRTGDAPKAIEMQQALLQATKSPEAKRRRTVELAMIHEQVARDPKKAEALLEAARKEFPGDVELLSAVAAFYTRSNRVPALHVLLDRAAGDARRALATGRFDVGLFAMLGAVAKLRDRTHAARISEATVAAIEGRPSKLGGAEQRAADSRFDDLLAPELLTPAFRSLLAKSGEILDAAMPVDLKSLRAVPLPQPLNAIGAEIKDLGSSFGLPALEVFVSPTLGAVCMPIGSHPPQIVVGQSLMASGDDEIRKFLVRRALKAVQARASALSRSAPIDLLPLVSAYLLLFAPDWQPNAVDPGKLRDVHARLQKVKPKRLDDDVGMLALEVIGSLGNRASTLHTVVNGWGNRVALLASGDLSQSFTAIARAAGHAAGLAAGGPERVTWINRNAEARDLAVFSVSDAYAEARSRMGL